MVVGDLHRTVSAVRLSLAVSLADASAPPHRRSSGKGTQVPSAKLNGITKSVIRDEAHLYNRSMRSVPEAMGCMEFYAESAAHRVSISASVRHCCVASAPP